MVLVLDQSHRGQAGLRIVADGRKFGGDGLAVVGDRDRCLDASGQPDPDEAVVEGSQLLVDDRLAGRRIRHRYGHVCVAQLAQASGRAVVVAIMGLRPIRGNGYVDLVTGQPHLCRVLVLISERDHLRSDRRGQGLRAIVQRDRIERFDQLPHVEAFETILDKNLGSAGRGG